ncbi:3-deoxy-manno-octulosonate cytidylyltransferase [Flavobacterium aurantiibacter]|uniref:3-deoxy-manno-octulosonate cytidylyltransferase n=1 Tax=Flavobacterium aurantiibacter TaxID=2023067 RepID=A0A255ZVR4_9FLAO|nr:3-deoxy-manno-octulosonate cytidylyltransferase [Flavobacterium aurantiibacter]OYQ45489.1 3-deoxy-manno-octulosonate cytidylyltransferase [Flavobacterium aurantiibacter]
MNCIAVIPARLESTRLPRKLLQDLGGEAVIVRTYRAVNETGLFDKVLVATDSEEIADVIKAAGGAVFMSLKAHESGSDRIAEAVKDLDCDVVINIQGDEPFVDATLLKQLVSVFENDVHRTVDVASVMTRLTEQGAIENPNHVKVVVDSKQHALYFSRLPIPYLREGGEKTIYFKHIGVYGFRKNALLSFAALPAGILENSEKLEQLRYLENGFRIKMVETEQQSIGIDTAADLELARTYLKNH